MEEGEDGQEGCGLAAGEPAEQGQRDTHGSLQAEPSKSTCHEFISEDHVEEPL